MTHLHYGSLCSGIEAATQAWHPLGWTPAFFSEVAPFPSAVLAHHYPHVPNLGDMTRFEDWPDHAIDLLVGGTPCQSFSVAGLRKGLADPRGNLMLTFGAVAQRYKPRWLVWENVPGVLSSDGGRDFGTFLGMLAELGYGFAYRVLDAQYVRTRGHAWAVPQRRRRVFVVGYFGDWRRAAAVLFDGESLSGNPAPRREAGQGIAISPSLRAQSQSSHRLDAGAFVPAVAHTLRGEGYDASEDGGGKGTPIIPISFGAQNAAAQGDGVTVGFVPALDKSKTPAVAFDMRGRESGAQLEGPHDTANIRAADGGSSRSYVASPWAVRRLTPRECERLQAFPDDFTRIPYRGKPADQCPDGPRYKALGNSMAVNVMTWLGERIALVEGAA